METLIKANTDTSKLEEKLISFKAKLRIVIIMFITNTRVQENAGADNIYRVTASL